MCRGATHAAPDRTSRAAGTALYVCTLCQCNRLPRGAQLPATSQPPLSQPPLPSTLTITMSCASLFVFFLLLRLAVSDRRNHSNSYSELLQTPATPSPHQPPPPEQPPFGIRIYEDLKELPTRLLSEAPPTAPRCQATPQQVSPKPPYICGTRCDTVLLAMHSHCRNANRNWVPCSKPRKFRRCFPRICYRKLSPLRAPAPYFDHRSVAIVRYRRPLPLHERRARRNRQSSSLSAIFK